MRSSGTLTIQEIATLYGVSHKTIRRKLAPIWPLLNPSKQKKVYYYPNDLELIYSQLGKPQAAR